MVDFYINLFSSIELIKSYQSSIFIISVLLAGIPIFGFMAINALVAVYVERKVSAFMQDRLGPMGHGVGLHAGKWGVLQTLADAIKLLTKEDIIPESADKKLFLLAPCIIFIGSFVAFAGFPFNEFLIAADFNLGLFYILAMSSVGVIGIILAGYSSNNKWSLYGSMRSAAQIVSYEIPAALSLLPIVMLSGSLAFKDIVLAQTGSTLGILPNWFIFNNPFMIIAFWLFFIAGVAEVNRTPFDLPEAESELVAGWMTEYSGMRWAFFFLAEYANMFIVAGVATIGFLGGWLSPIPGYFDGSIWGVFWLVSKTSFLIFVMMWFRWTFPRLRTDQLMRMCWKFFLPGSFFVIIGVGLWDLIMR